jgi:hypothetical protein
MCCVELRREERSLQLGEDVARADVDPRVLVDETAEESTAVGPLLADHLGAFDQGGVVQEQRTAFAAREVLRLVEAQRGGRAERSERSASVGGEEPVRVVFHDRDPAPACEVHDRIELARHPGVMQRNDRARAVGDEPG